MYSARASSTSERSPPSAFSCAVMSLSSASSRASHSASRASPPCPMPSERGCRVPVVRCRGGACSSRRNAADPYRLPAKMHQPIASVAALIERHAGWQVIGRHRRTHRLPDLSLRGGRRPTWQSRSTQSNNRKAVANTVILRGGASRTPPPTRRVRSAILPENLQLPKALTERRYRRNRCIPF